MKRALRLSEATDAYLTHCRGVGLSHHTIRNIGTTLRQFVGAVGDIQLRHVEPRHVTMMFSGYDWAVSTRNNRVKHLHAFFAWCRAAGHLGLTVNPMFGYRRRPVPDVDRTRIPVSQWGTLLDACHTPHERVQIATGLFLFLRASEQQALKVEHVNLVECEIQIYRSKTGEWDTMPIVSELSPVLRDWLEHYSSRVALKPEHHLIPCVGSPVGRTGGGRYLPSTGEFIPTKPVRNPHLIVQRVMARCGFPTFWEGEHTLRRSGARAYFDQLVSEGYDGALRRVMTMLGHKQSKTTEVYLGLNIDRHTRNADLKGRPMFPTLTNENVIPLRGRQWRDEK